MTTPASTRGIIANVTRLKMVGEQTIEAYNNDSTTKNWKNQVWRLIEDDGSHSPYFGTDDLSVTKQSCDLSDFEIVGQEAIAEIDIDENGYTKTQRGAITTFVNMLNRANDHVTIPGSLETRSFNPQYGICDNIERCTPPGVCDNQMAHVKDNLICLTQSYSGSPSYPVSCPDNTDPDRAMRAAERAWDNSSDKWVDAYGQMRVLQLSEIIELIKTKWDESLVSKKTPAKRMGLVVRESIVMHIENNTLYVLQHDDGSSDPYFLPYGDTNTDNRRSVHLSNLVLVKKDDLKKQSVKSILAKHSRIKAKRDVLKSKIKELQTLINILDRESTMLDVSLSTQHGVKRVG